MAGAKPGWKCRRCRQMQTHSSHTLRAGVFYCEDGQPTTFERFITKPTRRTMSFSGEDLRMVDTILAAMRTGRDLSVIVRSPIFISLAARIGRMRTKSKAAADAKETP